MKMKRLSFVAALAVLAAVSPAQNLEIHKYKLSNGMTVILHPDHSSPLVAVNLWFRVGSKDEPPRRSGFAHLFEHLMFMGTERVPTGQYDKMMETYGGSNNASTTSDRTNYYASGPARLLPTLLWLEADRIDGLGKAMDQKKLDLQRDVVKNERRQNVEDQPYGEAYVKLSELLYPEGHPYHLETIGKVEDLDNATVKDVKDFFSTFYVANNVSLVVAGDFDLAEAKKLISKYFGALPRQNDPVHATPQPVKLTGVKSLTMVDIHAQQIAVFMAWHSPAAGTSGDADMSLTAGILGSGASSRLYQEVVVKQGLATDVSAFQQSQMLGSVFVVTANAAPGVSAAALQIAIDKVVRDYLAKGPTADELKRQIAQIEYGTINGLQQIANKADTLNQFEFQYGDPNGFARFLNSYRSATPQRVLNVAKQVLDLNARVIEKVLPQSSAASGAALNDKPQVGPAKSFAPQQPVSFSLVNGMKVFYWYRPALPLATVTTQFVGGTQNDPLGKEGLAFLTAQMLSQGTGSMDSKGFEDALNMLGANFSANAGSDTTNASLTVSSRNLKPALQLYSDTISKPRMIEKDFTRIVGIHEADLKQSLSEVSSLARRVGAREFFGATHPYGRPDNGSLESIKKISLKDILTEHLSEYRPSGSVVFAAADLPLEQLKADLNATIGQLKATGKGGFAKVSASPAQPKEFRVVFVDVPGSAQTAVRFYMPGAAFSTSDRLELQAIGTILGGSFTSRLNQNLREDKGYTYGAGARFTFEPSLGFVVASANVQAQSTGPSIKEFMKEFASIRSGNITDQEAEKARSTMMTDIVDALGSQSGILGIAASYKRQGLRFGGLSTDLKAMNDITASRLNAIVRGAIPLEHCVLVLVGDKAKVVPQLEGLGLPKIDEVKGG